MLINGKKTGQRNLFICLLKANTTYFRNFMSFQAFVCDKYLQNDTPSPRKETW